MTTARQKSVQKVTVFGAEMLHPITIAAFTKMLRDEPDNSLNAIVISDTGPMDRYGEYYKHLKTVCISLPYILSQTVKAMEKKIGLSLAAGIHANTIHTFAHELHHNIAYTTDWEGTEENLQAEEEEADQYATKTLDAIILSGKFEPPQLAELPWFRDQVDSEESPVFSKGDIKFETMKGYFEAILEAEEKNPTTESEPVIELANEHNNANAPSPESVQETTVDNSPFGNIQTKAKKETIAEPTEPTDPFGCNAPTEKEAGATPTGVKPAQPKLKTNTIKGAAISVYLRLYNHMFNQCGFDKGSFTNLEEIIHPIKVDEPISKMGLFSKCYTLSSKGGAVWEDIQKTGNIRGRTFAKGTIPGYMLQLNITGSTKKILVIAQNPATGSPLASEAVNGHKIVWVIDVDNNKYVGKVYDGTYTSL